MILVFINCHSQGRAQFYIIVYHFCGGCLDAEVVDRVLINMDLSISPHFTERRTYSGIHNISQFDLSFRIRCSENYGPTNCTQCLQGRDPSTNCTQCLQGRDPSTGCATCLPGMYRRTEADLDCSAVQQLGGHVYHVTLSYHNI